MNEFDQNILKHLQRDCRSSVADIAAQVGLSKSATHRRMQQLEQGGYIDRYAALLNADKLGYTLMFTVNVTLSGQSDENLRVFEANILNLSEVYECQLTTGQNDYALKVAARNTAHYEQIHRRLAGMAGVAKIESSLVLRTIKPWSGLPVSA